MFKFRCLDSEMLPVNQKKKENLKRRKVTQRYKKVEAWRLASPHFGENFLIFLGLRVRICRVESVMVSKYNYVCGLNDIGWVKLPQSAMLWLIGR